MSTKDLSRWSGIACILAGLLIVLATLIHPSRETPEIILEQELRLIAAHWLYTFFCGFLLLGLPGLYAAHSIREGWAIRAGELPDGVLRHTLPRRIQQLRLHCSSAGRAGASYAGCY